MSDREVIIVEAPISVLVEKRESEVYVATSPMVKGLIVVGMDRALITKKIKDAMFDLSGASADALKNGS